MNPNPNQPAVQFPTGYFVGGPQNPLPTGPIPTNGAALESATAQQPPPIVQQQTPPMVQLGQQYMPMSQAAFQWSPDINLLREISSRGAGAYRIHMTVGQPPAGYPPSAFPQPLTSYPTQQTGQFFQEPGRLAGPYYNTGGVDVSYMGQPYTIPTGPPGAFYYPGVVNGLPVGRQPQPVQAVDEARNPLLGQSVSMLQAGNGETDPNLESSRRKSRKRKRSDPDRPKPARYAWNFFFKEKYQKLRNGGGSGLFDVQEAFTKIGLKLGNAWKGLTPEERQPYLDMAAKDKQRYEREMEKYKAGLYCKDSSKDDDEDDTDVKEQPDNSDTSEIGNDDEKELSRNDADSTDKTPVDAAGEASDKTENETSKDKTENLTQVTADILVTDDDENFIFLMEATLRRLHTKFNGAAKLDIHIAKNGQEAIKKVVDEQHKYAVITMDKEMGPDSPDGYQTVKTIRDAGYDGFVLGLTGNEGCEEKFQENGANATLCKTADRLYSQIYNIVIEKLNDQGERDHTDNREEPKEPRNGDEETREPAKNGETGHSRVEDELKGFPEREGKVQESEGATDTLVSAK